jgi:hypothetical protein
MAASWKALGSPVLTPEVQKKVIASVHAEAGSRTIEELEADASSASVPGEQKGKLWTWGELGDCSCRG